MNLMNLKGRLSTVGRYILCRVKFARGVLAFFFVGGGGGMYCFFCQGRIP